MSRNIVPLTQRIFRRIAFVSALAGATVLSGCAVGPNYVRPDVAEPVHYKEAAAAAPASETAPETWWSLFDDSTLNDLESQVEVSNQDLAGAQAAYAQSLAAVREQRATLFPQATLDASASHTSGRGSSARIATGSSRGPDSYQAGVGASWEIDLWGRLRRSLENAHALADASAADLASARLSIQGQLATAYLQLREADAEQQLLLDTATAYARSLQIAQNRYAAGMAAKTDVLLAQTQLANAQDQATALQLQRSRLEHAIAALIGKPASDFSLPVQPQWSTAVPDVPAGVPSTLVQRRPDIAASERRAAAANAAIGAQEATYFPSLTLTGSHDFISTAAAGLFNSANVVGQLAASVTQTLFDAGATSARVAGARAGYDQTVAQYRQNVISAFQDVEDQLASSRLLEQQYEARREAAAAADETEQLTMNQYRAGTVSYTSVVVVQTAALQARRALAVIEVERQTTAVALITALGGGWSPTRG
jgi:NodT family efflux transporter outer membrane factor (OMF) lipoprotein